MTRRSLRDAALLALRLYLGGIFVFASVHKILDPASFALDVATYGILPPELVNLVALVLPWVELVAGLMLAVGFRTAAGALLVDGMLLVFIAALASALHRGVDTSCGCFASDGGDHPIGVGTVLRDLGWLALGLAVLFLDRNPLGVDRWLDRRARGRSPEVS